VVKEIEKEAREDEFDYPKEVLQCARDENDQVTIHALTIYMKFLDQKLEYQRKWWRRKPWNPNRHIFTDEELTWVINTSMVLAEQFRMVCEQDLRSRLKFFMDKYDKIAPHIHKPSLRIIKDHIRPGTIPGLHDQQ
jgi:hypothetical protein